MERFFDILLSSFSLLVLSPLLLPILFILRCTGEGEVFFKQERIGRYGQTFKLFKFATMLKNSPNMGTGTLTIDNDPRVLPFGVFLRKTKINELPQLLNILKGDMSIIGPRPLTRDGFDVYTNDTKNQIMQVRPGLSGIGSIIFSNEEAFLNDEENSIDFYKKIIAPFKGELETWFVSNKSIGVYFLAIFATIWVILFSEKKIAWSVFSDLPEPPDELKHRFTI